MTSDQPLPEPLTEEDIDAVLWSYWTELEFADWRIQGATDPGFEQPTPADAPGHLAEYDEWCELVGSLAFSEALASIDWDAELAGLDELPDTGS